MIIITTVRSGSADKPDLGQRFDYVMAASVRLPGASRRRYIILVRARDWSGATHPSSRCSVFIYIFVRIFSFRFPPPANGIISRLRAFSVDRPETDVRTARGA